MCVLVITAKEKKKKEKTKNKKTFLGKASEQSRPTRGAS